MLKLKSKRRRVFVFNKVKTCFWISVLLFLFSTNFVLYQKTKLLNKLLFEKIKTSRKFNAEQRSREKTICRLRFLLKTTNFESTAFTRRFFRLKTFFFNYIAVDICNFFIHEIRCDNSFFALCYRFNVRFFVFVIDEIVVIIIVILIFIFIVLINFCQQTNYFFLFLNLIDTTFL